MFKFRNNIVLALALFIACIFSACNPGSKVKDALFVTLDSKRTGIQFNNKLTYDPQFNLFKYMYFYNGSGVGAADFNKDGQVDLFFGSNQHNNQLYLNTGNITFKEVTKEAAIPDDGGWTTGISVIDINNDGWIFMYAV